MNLEALVPTIILVVVFALGLDATLWLGRNYAAIAPTLTDPRNRVIGWAFVVVSRAVVIAVGWLGFLTIRRLLGFEQLEWSFVASWAVSVPALLIPVYLKRVWKKRMGGG